MGVQTRRIAEKQWRKGRGDYEKEEILLRVHERGVLLAVPFRNMGTKEKSLTEHLADNPNRSNLDVDIVAYPQPGHMDEFASHAKKALLRTGPSEEYPGSVGSLRLFKPVKTSGWAGVMDGQFIVLENSQGHYKLRGNDKNSKETGLSPGLERAYCDDWRQDAFGFLFDICRKTGHSIVIPKHTISQMKSANKFINDLNEVATRKNWKVRVDDLRFYLQPKMPKHR